ncbi:MAG: TetR/AcrR family transcriptional regulator [Myxococcota bacterium]
MRRVPRQERSRRRVEAILQAAHALVVEHGSDQLKMSEVATRANVPIGSVYQYFPDKQAILRELALNLMAEVRDMLRVAMANIGTKAEAVERIDAVLQGYFEAFKSDPGKRDIWAATQSDKELQQLDVEDSRANAQILAEGIGHLVAPQNQERMHSALLLFAHLAGSAARLAIAIEPDEGERLMVALRESVRHQMDALLESRKPSPSQPQGTRASSQ